MIKVLKYWQSPQYANHESLWRAGVRTSLGKSYSGNLIIE